MKKTATLFVLLIVMFAGIWLLSTYDASPKAVESSTPPQDSVALAMLARQETVPSITTGLEQLPPSLRDTEVDGVLRVDNNGNLVIDHDIRRVFDYFLSTLGEESLSVIELRLRAYIRHQLPATAAQQAEQLLEDYLALNRALSDLQAPADGDTSSTPDTATLRERLSSIQDLRRQYLPADVVDAFYADDDALDLLTLGRMDIVEDQTLSTTQKTQALSALEQSLPQHLQGVINELNQHQQMSTLTEHLRRQGGTEAEVYQLRESFFGADAAERLAQLDQSRQQWQARSTQWLGERDSLIARQDIDAADRQRQLDLRRRDLFEPAELRRIDALERLHDQGLQ